MRLINVSKTFGAVEALKSINLDIHDGELFAVLGPSGCGKTTLLRIIAGLEKPTRGRVYFDDIDVTDVPAEIRDVSMVFQFYALYPTTVFNNIALPLRSKGYSEKDVEKRVREIARLVGIDQLLYSHVDRLNIADKQKVALARAIAKEPQIYLLDEPLTILDPVTRVIMRSELKKIQRQLEQTIIYVTHDQIEALTLADRIAIMNFGVVEQVGTPREVYSNPYTTFVGWFLGEPGMNFIEATVDKDNLGLRIGYKEVFRDIELGKKLVDLGLDRVLIGFRAENVVLSRDIPETGISGSLIIDGVIRVIEFFGTHYVVDVETDGAEFKVKLSVSEFNRLMLSENDKIKALIGIDKVSFFNVDDNKRIL